MNKLSVLQLLTDDHCPNVCPICNSGDGEMYMAKDTIKGEGAKHSIYCGHCDTLLCCVIDDATTETEYQVTNHRYTITRTDEQSGALVVLSIPNRARYNKDKKAQKR